jgi:small basic protein (TIGR04137 family)
MLLLPSFTLIFRIMSQHNSFNATGGGGKKNRTVLKRFERVDLLRKRGQWADGARVVGLKKTKPED